MKHGHEHRVPSEFFDQKRLAGNLDLREDKLKKKLRLYRISCFALSGLLAIAGAGGFLYIRGNSGRIIVPAIPINSPARIQAPHAAEVRRIMNGLYYKGLPMLLRKEVTLKLDFENQGWTLQNLHHFDKEGNLILEGGKFGACGELAAHTYRMIRQIFNSDYTIEFVRAAQAGYFLSPQASHTLLRITPKAAGAGDPSGPEAYILDPSFRRYGPVSEFEDYLFFESYRELPFIKYQDPDLAMPVQNATPLMIEKNYLLSFVVEGVRGTFDENNYTVALTLTKKNNYAGRFVFALRRNQGVNELFENRSLVVPNLMDEREYQEIRDKLQALYEGIK